MRLFINCSGLETLIHPRQKYSGGLVDQLIKKNINF